MNKELIPFIFAWTLSLLTCVAMIFYYFDNKVGDFYIVNKYNFYELINFTLSIFVSSIALNTISFLILWFFKDDYGVDLIAIGLILILPILYIMPLFGYTNIGFYEFSKFIIESDSHLTYLSIIFTVLVLFGLISRLNNIKLFSLKNNGDGDE